MRLAPAVPAIALAAGLALHAAGVPAGGPSLVEALARLAAAAAAGAAVAQASVRPWSSAWRPAAAGAAAVALAVVLIAAAAFLLLGPAPAFAVLLGLALAAPDPALDVLRDRARIPSALADAALYPLLLLPVLLATRATPFGDWALEVVLLQVVVPCLAAYGVGRIGGAGLERAGTPRLVGAEPLVALVAALATAAVGVHAVVPAFAAALGWRHGVGGAEAADSARAPVSGLGAAAVSGTAVVPGMAAVPGTVAVPGTAAVGVVAAAAFLALGLAAPVAGWVGLGWGGVGLAVGVALLGSVFGGAAAAGGALSLFYVARATALTGTRTVWIAGSLAVAASAVAAALPRVRRGRPAASP